MASNIENNKRIAKNTLLLYVRMIFLMFVSLYTSRVVLATLGVSDFGVYNIVGGVVVLFSFLNNAMVGSTQRFLNFALGRNDDNELSRVFSMSINCQFLIILSVLLLSETVGLWFLNTYLNIPASRMVAANWIYQFSVFAMCFGIYYAPYNAAIIAYERMSVYAYISIVEAVLKLVIVYLLTVGHLDKLILYGFLILVVQIIISAIYCGYSLKKFKICHYKYISDITLFKKLMSFSGWSLFGSIASIGTAQGINIIQNMFFGVVINAAMGVANQVNNALSGFYSNFSMAYRPQITKYYAAGDREYFMRLVFRMSKFTYLLLLFVSLPVIICCNDILNIWLEKVPEHAVTFCRIMIYFSLIEAMSVPLWMAVQATGRIRRYQIEISIIKLLVLPISLIGLYLGAPTEYILWINLVDNLGNHIYRIYYLYKDKDVKLNVYAYTKLAMFPCIIVTLLSFPVPYMMRQYLHGSVWMLIILCVTVCITAITTFKYGLENEERKKLVTLIVSKIKR